MIRRWPDVRNTPTLFSTYVSPLMDSFVAYLLSSFREWILPYMYLAKLRILAQLAYRFEAFAGFASSIIPMLSMIFVWRAAYSGIDTVEGVSASQMVTYAIISFSIKDVFYCETQDKILASVRNGSVAIDMIRPFHPLGRLLAENIAVSCGVLVRRFVPLLVFSTIFFQFPWPASAPSFVLFLLSCVMSYAILWLLSALMGLVAFWWMELGNLGMVKDAAIRLLSGSLVPLWLFPVGIQQVAGFLPFQYTYQTPLSIFIGKLSMGEAIYQMGLQLFWVSALVGAILVVWNRAKTKLLVQGG